MLDFSSSLYLGFSHPSRSLHPWTQLTLGKPARLSEPPGAVDAGKQIAKLQGCEQGIVMPSTLHAFWDLFGLLTRKPVVVYLDARTYPIARWGAERARASGIAVRTFPHHDAAALHRRLHREMVSGHQPVVVTDGFCPACGTAPPLTAYLDAARRFDGYLVLDDTQALGIFGTQHDSRIEFGMGGGGSLRRQNLAGPDIIVGASLAKGFGVPLAVLSGSHVIIDRVRKTGETLLHCSPPSVASIQAARRAILLNDRCGNALRFGLAQRIRHFREALSGIDLFPEGGMFPIQTLRFTPEPCAAVLHQQLLQAGIRSVVLGDCCGKGSCLGFILTARHRIEDIERCVSALARVTRTPKRLCRRHLHG